MKKILQIIGAALVLLIFIFGISKLEKNNSRKKPTPGSNYLSKVQEAPGFALVELFTSEGCSSCPAADELVNQLAAEKKQNLFILSYHVDYWDRLGWKDKFSKAVYSNRQREYAAHFNNQGVYTPQIVVNGTTEFVGSDKSKLYSSIKNNLNAVYTSPIQLTATTINNRISVSYQLDTKESASFNIAVVLLSGSTRVGNGENEGRFLKHTNIVVDLATGRAGTQKGEMSFKLPAPKLSIATGYKVVAFLQNDNGKITAATESAINNASF